MEFTHFSRNGELRPIVEASIPLSNIDYQYGFGVYETIRVENGVPYFLDEHIERLIHSAEIIDLAHPFTREAIESAIRDLVGKTEKGTYNLKVLLIGGGEPMLDIMCLNPHFPDKRLYRDGVHCITYPYERAFPHAKTLNMFQSYMAYKKSKDAGAYDALFLDRNNCVLEGTRTNFFCVKGRTLYSPPEEKILLGVTRTHVIEVAKESGFTVQEQEINYSDISLYDGAFLTSTSSKIMPIHSIDEHSFGEQPAALKELMGAFDAFLAKLK